VINVTLQRPFRIVDIFIKNWDQTKHSSVLESKKHPSVFWLQSDQVWTLDKFNFEHIYSIGQKAKNASDPLVI